MIMYFYIYFTTLFMGFPQFPLASGHRCRKKNASHGQGESNAFRVYGMADNQWIATAEAVVCSHMNT